MEVKGKTTIFVEEKTTSKGVIRVFNTSISHKTSEEGKDPVYTNARINVRFSKNGTPTEDQLKKLEVGKCYQIEIEEGYLDCRSFTRQDGTTGREIYIQVLKAHCIGSKDVEKKPLKDANGNDLPF